MTRLTSKDDAPVSKLCFGTMQFGSGSNKNQSESIFYECRKSDINFFDTAHVYNQGESERFLGKFVKKERENLIVATKVAYTGGSSKNTILSQFDVSRTRLDMEYVDILYLHRWDPDTALEESFETLARLQEQGQVRYLGVSNFSAWQVMKAQTAAQKLNTKIDIIQPMYSLVKRQAEVELLPMAQSEQIAVASYSPLGAGLLTGKYCTEGVSGRLASDTRYAARYGQEWMHKTACDFVDLANKIGVHSATLATAWAAYHPAVTAPIISARTVDQLAPSLAAMDLKLSDDDRQRITALSPTPAPATDRLEEA